MFLKERTKRIKFRNWGYMRLWVDGKSRRSMDAIETDACNVFSGCLLQGRDRDYAAHTIMTMVPELNAIELISAATEEGVVLYRDWP